MKHPDSQCHCSSFASPLALRWHCPDCGKGAIMKVSTVDCVCDGESLRKVEANSDQRGR